MLSEIPYASFLVYPPRPTSAYGRWVKNFVLGLKQDRIAPGTGLSSSAYVALRISEAGGDALLRFFTDAILVPAPRSAPLTRGALWAPHRIATALFEHLIGADVVPLLVRTEALSASHLSSGPQRAWPDQHRDSLEVKRNLPVGYSGRVVVVDDVVTRGSTLLGCAQALNIAYPLAQITGFAVARTLKEDAQMPDNAIQPAIGEISYTPGWLSRNP